MIIECPICKESVLIPTTGEIGFYLKKSWGEGYFICLNCKKLFSFRIEGSKEEVKYKKVKNKWIFEDYFISTVKISEKKYDYRLDHPWEYGARLFLLNIICPFCKEVFMSPIIGFPPTPVIIPYSFNIKGSEILGCIKCDKVFLINLKEGIKNKGIRKLKKLKNEWIHKTKLILTIEEYDKSRENYNEYYNILQKIKGEMKKW